MATVMIRTILMYVILLIVLRLMGKRQVGELEVSEFITTLMLSEIIVVPITDRKVPVLYGIIPVMILVSIEIVLSLSMTKYPFIRRLLLGSPTIIISKGVLQRKQLEKVRMSTTELISELRLKGFSSIEDVEYAIIEDNGQMSVFPKADIAPLTPKDVNISPSAVGISQCVVSNGKILRSSLDLCGKSEEWILDLLSKRGLKLSDIYLMTADETGNVSLLMY